MKKYLSFVFCIIAMTIICSCQKDQSELNNYNVKFKIDSVKQDTRIFALETTIYGIVHVYYTVENNDNLVLNCYRYTINAMSCDSIYYQIAKSHYNTVLPNSVRHDSTKIGIGNSRIAYTRIDNTLFQ